MTYVAAERIAAMTRAPAVVPGGVSRRETGGGSPGGASIIGPSQEKGPGRRTGSGQGEKRARRGLRRAHGAASGGGGRHAACRDRRGLGRRGLRRRAGSGHALRGARLDEE